MPRLLLALLPFAVKSVVLYILNGDTEKVSLSACSVGDGATSCRDIPLAWTMTSSCRCVHDVAIGKNGMLHVASGCGGAPCFGQADHRICGAPLDGSGSCKVTSSGFKMIFTPATYEGPGILSDGDDLWVLDRMDFSVGDTPSQLQVCPSAGSFWPRGGCKLIDQEWLAQKTSNASKRKRNDYMPRPWTGKVYKGEAFIVYASGPHGEQDAPWSVRACTKTGACRNVGNWPGLKFLDDIVIANDTIFAVYNKAELRWMGNYTVRACHIYDDKCWELGGFWKIDGQPQLAASEDRIFIRQYISKRMPHKTPRGGVWSSSFEGGGWEKLNLGNDQVNVFSMTIVGDSLYVANKTDDVIPQPANTLKCLLSSGICVDSGLPHIPFTDLYSCENCTLKESSEQLVV